MELVDTHCHLDMAPLADQVPQVLERAAAAGVRTCVTIGTDVEASRRTVALARQHPMLRAAVGVHPHEADGVTDDTLAAIDDLASAPEVVAIGETGLDHYYKHSSLDAQQRVFEAFLGIARRTRLPILLHCRNAYEELLAVLRAQATSGWRGVIHGASGPPAFIEGCLALGLHISFSGTVTFPKADAVRQLVPLVPDDRLLLETDAPYLAPVPVRGRPNEPAHVAHTAAFVAQLRGVSPEALGELTSRNARTLFGL
jgi:TatD DNase family protein